MIKEIKSEIRKIRRITYAGMAVNVTVTILKGIGGLVFSSQALFADAVHSLSDLVTDVAVVLGVRYWSAPADDEHPYGHGKIEALITLFIAVALAIVAGELTVDAVKSFFVAGRVAPGIAAFVFALLSVVAKEVLYRCTAKVAEEVKSPALKANAWHHRSDAISSVPVAVAIAIAYFFPKLVWVDAVGAVLVSGFILIVAWEIAKPALQELVDASIDDKAKAAEMVARKVSGIVEVHRVRARRYSGAFAVDLHVHVSPTLSIAEGHRLGHNVEDALLKSDLSITDVVVHVEPSRK